MANNLTNYEETRLLKYYFRGLNLGTCPTLYIGLFTAAPGEAGGGTEVSGGAYARKSLASAFGTDPTGSTTISNDAEVAFDAATANWGTITHAAIFDASSGGNMVWYAALAASKVIQTGDILRFLAGNLTFTFE